MNVFRALEASLHEHLGPAAAAKAPAILDTLWRAGAVVVPREVSCEEADAIRSTAMYFVFERPPTDGRHVYQHIYELLIWKLYTDSRRLGDRGFSERQVAIDAEVRERSAQLLGGE